jgi:hypothetical protein
MHKLLIFNATISPPLKPLVTENSLGTPFGGHILRRVNVRGQAFPDETGCYKLLLVIRFVLR